MSRHVTVMAAVFCSLATLAAATTAVGGAATAATAAATTTTTTTAPFVSPEDGKVLVLGSGGMIGSAVVGWLRAHGYETLEVRGRDHVDLRRPGALDEFDGERVSFAFFLACEVGGSKFLDAADGSVQEAIVDSNVRIYQTVLPWLRRRGVPFLFSSSYLQMQPTSYGTVKRLGERWVDALGAGRTVRLWNVYGHERIGIKSHVISDWVASCLGRGRLECRTQGLESRQFLHVRDCAEALGTMMRAYDRLGPVTDLSSGEWVRLRDLAAAVAEASPRACEVSFTDEPATVRERLDPDTDNEFSRLWSPATPLGEGLALMYRQYAEDEDGAASAAAGRHADGDL